MDELPYGQGMLVEKKYWFWTRMGMSSISVRSVRSYSLHYG
jgi:hypothetical protein